MPDDVLGITAHQNPLQSAPAVRAADDQMRWPLARLIDDDFAGAIADALDEPILDLEACRAGGGLRFMQDGLAGAIERRRFLWGNAGAWAVAGQYALIRNRISALHIRTGLRTGARLSAVIRIGAFVRSVKNQFDAYGPRK